MPRLFCCPTALIPSAALGAALLAGCANPPHQAGTVAQAPVEVAPVPLGTVHSAPAPAGEIAAAGPPATPAPPRVEVDKSHTADTADEYWFDLSLADESTTATHPIAPPAQAADVFRRVLANRVIDRAQAKPAGERESSPPLAERPLYKQAWFADTAPELVVEDDEADGTADPLAQRARGEYGNAAVSEVGGYPTRALGSYVAAAKQDPDNVFLKLRAAQAALSQLDLPRAEALAEEILDVDADNYRAMLVRASVEMYRDKWQAAKPWYEKVLAVKPKNVQALEMLARISREKENNLEATKKYAARIMETTSKNLTAILLHAEASALTGDIKYAAELYGRLVHYRPQLIDSMIDLARRLDRGGRHADALGLVRQGVILDPGSDNVLKAFEDLLRAQGGEVAVKEGYKGIADEFPHHLELVSLYAEYLERAKDIDTLVTVREQLLKEYPTDIPSLMSMAQVALSKGELEKANGYFDRAVAAGPDDPEVYRSIGLVYLDQKNYAKAEELLLQALAVSPSEPNTLMAMARLADEQSDPAKAEDLLHKALDAAPANPSLLGELGNLYRRQNRVQPAADVYAQILAAEPGNQRAALLLADCYFQLGGRDGLLDELEKRMADAATDKMAFYAGYGAAASTFGEWKRSRWGLENALTIDPGNLPVRRLLATVYLHLGDADRGLKVLTDAVARMKGDAQKTELQEDMASFYEIAGPLVPDNYTKAEGIWRKLVADNPDSLDYRASLVKNLARAGGHENVVSEMNDILRKWGPEHEKEVKILRAEIADIQHEPSKAVAILEELYRADPKDLGVKFQLANAYGNAEDLGHADRLYRELIDDLAKDPEHESDLANAYNNLAYLYANAGQKLFEAEEFARKALALIPRASHVVDTLGWVKFKQGDLQEARSQLQLAEKLSLDDDELLDHLGQVFLKLNDPVAARGYFERALRVDPHRDDLRKKLEEMAAKPSDEKPAGS